jgi:putative spermidine/putrescine transport system permease protein
MEMSPMNNGTEQHESHVRHSWFARIRRWDFAGVLLRSYAFLVFSFLLLPIFIVFVTSFTATTTVQFPPTEFSLQWYYKFVLHLMNAPGIKQRLLQSILFSIGLGAIVAVLSVVAGVLGAYALRKYIFRGKEVFRQIFILPLVFPQIVIGIALLVLFSATRSFSLFQRLVIGHVIIALPYVIMTVGASLEVYEEELEEAALGLGAGRIRTFIEVTIPLIRPGMIAASIFAFIVSFTQFTISFFLFSGEAKPLPMWNWEYISYMLDPTLAVISVFSVLLTMGVLIAIQRILGVESVISVG